MVKFEIYSLILTLFGFGLASKCPEPKKPHPTSCTIYYNCVNLPGGGYVWAPAKCTNGLVFQPYLRICVLPGDSWTCDILATETPETTTNQFPELIDSTQTSYLGYGDSSKFTDPTDYYKIDKYTEPIDSLEQTVTPYPLIEVTQPNNYVNQIDSTIKNLGVPIAIKHSEDNYLYHFINGQEVLSTPINANNQQLQAHLQRLINLIERLIAYQGLGIPLDRQLPSPISPTLSPLNYNNFPDENKDSAINYLVKNYILKSQAQNQGLKSLMNSINKDAATTMTTTAAINIDQEINGQENSNNIIMVKDGLNNRQYFTINKYKSIAHRLTTEEVKVIPCTSGVRHPNSTDCTKYYSCEPANAKIQQYSCPSNTAFNKFKRLCESHEFLLCMSLGGTEVTSRNSLPTIGTARDTESSIMSTEASENPCQTVGKHADRDSKRNYYLCFSDNGGETTNLKFRKMTCPNNLIFCEDKNVCTTKNRCSP